MAEYTVDTLAIEISADSKDAAANIQGLAEALSKLKDSLRGSTNGMSKLAERLKAIRGAAIGTNQSVTRMSELLNAITKLKDIKINKSIPDRIKELVTALSTLKDTDIKFTKENAQAIRRFGEALQGLKDVTISKSLPERIGALVHEVGTLTDDDIRQLEKLAASLEHLRGVDLSGFGNIMTETRRRAQEAKQEAKEAERLAAQQTTVTVDPTPIDGASDKVRTLQRELNALRRKAARIDVQSDGLDNAKRQIDEMRSRLKDVSRGKITVDSEQLDETKSKIAKIREELDKVSTKRKIEIEQSSLSKLFNSIKRVAFYRAIRTMIKGITDAFSTGIQDLYQYSNIVGTSFAPAMDRAASAILFFKNSLGSMVAPLLETLIPVLETVVDRVASIVDWLAQLFAALSGKSTYSRAVKSTTEFAKAATGAAKAMERYLAPFDELNVIQNSATGGAAGGGATNYGKMFEEAEISSNVLDLAKKIQPILDKIKEIASVLYEDLKPVIQWVLDHALEVGVAFAAWKIAKSFLSDIESVSSLLGTIGGVAKGLVLITIGAALSYDAGYDLGQDKENLLTWVKGIGGIIAAGIGGALIGAQVGGVPGAIAGFAIGVTIGVGFALAGYLQGTLDKVVNDAFFNGQGAITITELAESFKTLAEDIVKTNQPIIDAGNAIIDIRDNKVQPAIDKINEINTAISHGVTTAEEQIPNLVSVFEELKTGTSDILDEVYENVVRAVSGSLYDALTDAGVYVPELLDVLRNVKGEVDTTFESLQGAYQGLANEYAEGKISASEYQTSLTELANKMSELIGYTDPVAQSFANVSGELKGINWENEDQKNNAFTIIKNAAEEASASVDDAYKTINDNIQTMRGWSDDPVFQDALTSIFMANEATRESQRNQIAQNLQGLFDNIQNDIVDKTQNVIDRAKEEWDNMGWLEKLFSAPNEATYVVKAIKNYQNNIVDPISSEMESSFETLGLEAQEWANSSIDSVIEAMFDYGQHAYDGAVVYEFVDDLGVDVESALSTLVDKFKGHGKNMTDGLSEGLVDNVETVTDSVTDVTDAIKNTMETELDSHSPSRVAEGYGQFFDEGFANGLVDNVGTVTDAVADVTDAIQNTVKTELDIHSPSRVAEGYGQLFDEGLANGLTNNSETVKDALRSLLQELSEIYQKFFNGIINGHNDMLKNIDDSLKNTKTNGNTFSISKAKTVVVKPSAFATGGFPEDGLFFANHNEIVGKFANGRTAVANNEQIEGGIAAGVAEANEGVISALVSVGNAIVRAIEDSGKGSGVDLNRFARKLYPAMKQLDGVHGTAMVTG